MTKIATTCLKVDPSLKELFEEARPLHNKTLSDALQAGMLKVLEDSLPATVLDIQIEDTKRALSDLEQLKSKVLKIEADKKKLLDEARNSSATPVTDSILTEQRELLFSDKSFLTLLKKGLEPAWDRIYYKCGFESPGDAKKWFWSEALKRGLVK